MATPSRFRRELSSRDVNRASNIAIVAMLRCASGPICQRRVLSRSVELVSGVQRRLRRFHPVGIREAKGVYHHRFHLSGFAVMSVFELQQRNKRVFVQNLELVGQFLERHVSASFRCAIHAHQNRCSKERQETLVHGINRTSFAQSIPGSLAEGGSEAGKLSSNPSSRSFSRRAFFCNPFVSLSAFLFGQSGRFGVLRDMACLLSGSVGFED